MTNKHSPAPWTFRAEDESNLDILPPHFAPGEYYGNAAIFAADGQRVVGCGEYNVFSGENQAANVMLLLAAPESLAALQRAIAWCDEHGDTRHKWYADGVAACKKATGEPV